MGEPVAPAAMAFESEPSAAPTRLRVLHCVRSLISADGGPSRTVPALCEHLARCGAQVELMTTDLGPEHGPPLLPDPARVANHLLPTEPRAVRWWRAPQFTAALHARCAAAAIDVIHDHGFWLPTNHAAAVVARQQNVPLVITPRGMLAPWALRRRAWKKRLAWLLYAGRDVRQAAVLHATSQLEAEELRRLRLRQPIAVIANGLPLDFAAAPRATAIAPREVLFLSRLHPKKGLMDLIDAWAQLRPVGWRVVVAGPDEAGYRTVIERTIDAAQLRSSFELLGPVEGVAKQACLARASLLVLPTRSENFGVVVAEALAAGVPVITTHAAPWSALVDERCGWWVKVGVPPLIAALQSALALNDAERQEMGQRGSAFVARAYRWDGLAGQMRDVYLWLKRRGPQPECVRLD